MQVAESLQDVRQARQAAIAGTMSKVRQVEQSRGVTREALDEIRDLLLELAAHTELFPASDFPPHKDERGFDAIYRLSEDDDHRFALYMSTAERGKKVPPHDHTTWAVIAGVQGDELNVFYERSDDGSQPGRGTLREINRTVVSPGTAVTLMPDDIHHIETGEAGDTLHLHLYGLGLEQLSERVAYDVNAGTYKTMNVSPHILEAR